MLLQSWSTKQHRSLSVQGRHKNAEAVVPGAREDASKETSSWAAAGAAAIFSVATGATAGAAAGAAAAFSGRGERKRPSSLPVPCFCPELRGMARAAGE